MSLDDSFESVPDNAIQMITAYEKILAITDRMLEAAKNSDWEKLVALEQDCKHLTGQLIEQHSRYELSDEQQKKKSPSSRKYSPVMRKSAPLPNPG